MERKEQRSPFWGTKLVRPLPGTGTLRYRPSPSPHCPPPPPETTSFQYRCSEPDFCAACFLCPVRDSSPPLLHSPGFAPAKSHRRQRRRRDASALFPEGCADASSSLPEGWTTASRFSSAVLSSVIPSQGFFSKPASSSTDHCEWSVDAPASVLAGGQLDTQALVLVGDRPDLSETASSPSSAQLLENPAQLAHLSVGVSMGRPF
ncbi:hypothetical protein XENOCAPTIV_021516 [Xenoophorus captivus]|uniref:Uncharacterized protein n=1 Tax=Xenoophorus captivus TaxID=1517983 RepID=A0ABV0RSB1_9TELE